MKSLSDKLRDSTRRFQNYSDDLLRSDAPTFENALNAFIDFCESDQTMMPLTTPLKEDKSVNVAKFWTDMISSSKVTLPTDEHQKLCLLYQLLLNVRNNKFSIIQFGVNVFHSVTTNSSIYHFNEVFSRPLIRELRRKLNESQNQPIEEVTSIVTDSTAETGTSSTPIQVTAIMSPERETEVIIANLADRYQELGEQFDRAARQSGRATYSFYAFTGGFIITLFLAAPSLSLQRFFLPEYFGSLLVLDAGTLIFFTIFQRRFNKNKLDREQRLFLRVYALASELRPYPSSAPISDASKDLEYITQELESSWVLPFRLAKETLSSVAEFKKNLRRRLLPALTSGKTDDVKLSAWVLAKLCPLLIDDKPPIASVEQLNSAMSVLSEQGGKTEAKIHIRIREWWERHSIARSVGVMIACILVGVAIILGGQYLGYPREGFLAGVGGSIALYVGYLTSPRWKKGGSE